MAPKTAKRAGTLEYGTSGDAKMVKLDDTRARFDFSDETKKPVTLKVVQGDVFEEGSDATLPSYVPFKSMQPNKYLSVRVTFAKDDQKVLFINPLSGEQQVKFLKFQAPEGSEPTWTEKEGKGKNKDGSKKTYREAYPFFEIVDGRWKGCTIRGRIFDNFGLWEEDGLTTVYGTGTGSENLRDFCECVGFEYWSTPFSENHLPEIQKVALENNKKFSLVLVNGYISNFVAGSDDDAFADAMEASNKAHDSVSELLADESDE